MGSGFHFGRHGLDMVSAEPTSQHGATLAVASEELPEHQGVVLAP